MVELKADLQGSGDFGAAVLQSVYGRIESEALPDEFRKIAELQSVYGRIERTVNVRSNSL